MRKIKASVCTSLITKIGGSGSQVHRDTTFLGLYSFYTPRIPPTRRRFIQSGLYNTVPQDLG